MPKKSSPLLNKLRNLSSSQPDRTFTRGQIARHCGVPTSTIRRIEIKALGKLRQQLKFVALENAAR